VGALAGRLAALDQNVDRAAQERTEEEAGTPLTALAGQLVDALTLI